MAFQKFNAKPVLTALIFSFLAFAPAEQVRAHLGGRLGKPLDLERRGVDCSMLLEQAKQEISSDLTPDQKAISLVDTPRILMQTVQKVSERPGIHGGKQLQLQRLDESWFSHYTTTQFDPQGDPRTFITSVGSDVAQYFGFELENAQTLWAPDAVEFQGAIQVINQKQIEKNGESLIDVSFYSGESDLTLAEYLKRFTEEWSLPYADEGNAQIHDLSFHTGAIFLPKETLALIAPVFEDGHLLMEFIREKKRSSHGVERRFWEMMLKQVKTRYATIVDNFTGTLSSFFANYVNDGDLDLYHELLARMLSLQFKVPFSYQLSYQVLVRIPQETPSSPCRLTFHIYCFFFMISSFLCVFPAFKESRKVALMACKKKLVISVNGGFSRRNLHGAFTFAHQSTNGNHLHSKALWKAEVDQCFSGHFIRSVPLNNPVSASDVHLLRKSGLSESVGNDFPHRSFDKENIVGTESP
jgi:hypothetical protein